MSQTSYKISDSLFLVRHTVSKKTPAKPAEVPIDHILVIDCSGSMSYDLPKIREQMKRKLPKLLKKNDTLSVVWFSGRGQFGLLFEAEPIGTLADLQQVTKAIDRWLVPVGMTGFKEPLIEVSKLAERLAKANPGHARSLLFFTDGCDNQWSTADVIKAVEQAAGHVQSATFVEYGYYANRQLLAQMAEKSGGSLVFAEDFLRYEPQFEAAVQRKVTGAKRVEVELTGTQVGGFAFAMGAGDLTTYSSEVGKISVPEDLTEVFYLSPRLVGSSKSVAKASDPGLIGALYAAVSLFAVRMKPDVVYPILKDLGDVTFIEQFSTCFGKQKYSAFMEATKQAAFDEGLRLTRGFDPNLIPRDDAFTVLDVLNLLQQDEAARVLLDHESFQYSRIGRGRVDATDQLTDEERTKIDALTEEMKKTKDAKKIRALSEQISAISDKPGALKFERKIPQNGLPIDGLTFNESRPNVSFRVKIPGQIDLSGRNDPALKGSSLPSLFQCFVYRNYAVIKDGLVNISQLPVIVSKDTYEKLVAEGVTDALGRAPDLTSDTVEMVLDLGKLPVVNRQMIKELSAKDFFERSYELTRAKALQKVYKNYADALLPEKRSQGYADKYGDEAAAWLKTQGITDYNGFQPPHTTQAESTDVYTGKELKVSLKGLSSLPKVDEVKVKILKASAGGKVEWLPSPKLSAPGALMAEAIKEVENFLSSDIYQNAADRPAVLKAWLEGQTRAAIKKARALIFDVARATFCTVVGQVWFQEFSSIDENELTIKVDGNDLSCKVEMKEVEIHI